MTPTLVWAKYNECMEKLRKAEFPYIAEEFEEEWIDQALTLMGAPTRESLVAWMDEKMQVWDTYGTLHDPTG